LFNRFDFMMGEGNNIVMIIPGMLPHADTYTVSISENDIDIKAGYDKIASVPYENEEVYQRIANNVQIGVVEYDDPSTFPSHITKVAYVEVRRYA